MKILLLPVLMLGCFLTSCTKSTVGLIKTNNVYYSEKVDSTSLAGTWILISQSGGLTGATTNPSDNITISFDNSGNYKKNLNYAIAESGNYTIGLEKTIYYSDKIPVIYFATSSRTYFNAVALSNDSLSISDNMYDGFSYLYKKLQ